MVAADLAVNHLWIIAVGMIRPCVISGQAVLQQLFKRSLGIPAAHLFHNLRQITHAYGHVLARVKDIRFVRPGLGDNALARETLDRRLPRRGNNLHEPPGALGADGLRVKPAFRVNRRKDQFVKIIKAEAEFLLHVPEYGVPAPGLLLNGHEDIFFKRLGAHDLILRRSLLGLFCVGFPGVHALYVCVHTVERLTDGEFLGLHIPAARLLDPKVFLHLFHALFQGFRVNVRVGLGVMLKRHHLRHVLINGLFIAGRFVRLGEPYDLADVTDLPAFVTRVKRLCVAPAELLGLFLHALKTKHLLLIGQALQLLFDPLFLPRVLRQFHLGVELLPL